MADDAVRDIPEEMVETLARAFAEEESEHTGEEEFPITDHHRTVARTVLSDALVGRAVVDLPEANGADETGTWWNHDHGAVIADDLCTADTARYMRRRAGALLAAAHHIEQRLRASGVGVGEQP